MSSSRPYLPYLDGLRAIAIMAILVYHDDTAWLAGGFLGVEVFFVISGFIITRQLLDQWSDTHKIDVLHFWSRRLRRLYPGIVAMILATWIVVLCFFPEELRQVVEDLPYGFTCSSNWGYIFANRSYFETIGRPRLFQHLWQLGVQFQYYLIWPLLCLALFNLKRSIALSSVLFAAVLSASWMAYLYQPGEDPSRVYFGTDTRAGALLIGGLAALTMGFKRSPPSDLKAWKINAIGISACIGLIMFFVFAESTNARLFQGGFFCVSALTAVIIATSFVASLQKKPNLIVWLLGSVPAQTVGVRAYSIYLWHWPIFCLTQPWVDIPMDGLRLFVFRLALTAILSEAFYRFVESPVRNGAIGRAIEAFKKATGKRRKALALSWATAGCLAIAGCSSLVISTQQQLIAQENQQAVAEKGSIPRVEPVAELDAQKADVPTTDSQGDAKKKANNPPDNVVHALQTSNDCLGVPSSPRRDSLRIERGKEGKNWITRVQSMDAEKTPVFAIGDSVMLGAVDELLASIPGLGIDVQVGRQVATGNKVLAERRDKHILGDTVIVHLGNNGPMGSRQIDEIMQVLQDVKSVILVNLKIPRNYELENNSIIEAAAKKYPSVTLVDWRGNSLYANNIFGHDGIHLTAAGASLYTRLIKESICKARPASVP